MDGLRRDVDNAPFLLVFMIVFAFIFALEATISVLYSQIWRTTTGILVEVGPLVKDASKSTEAVTFVYKVGNVAYGSQSYGPEWLPFLRAPVDGNSFLRKKYPNPRGHRVTVYYDPRNPAKAALSRSLPWGSTFHLLIPLAFFLRWLRTRVSVSALLWYMVAAYMLAFAGLFIFRPLENLYANITKPEPYVSASLEEFGSILSTVHQQNFALQPTACSASEVRPHALTYCFSTNDPIDIFRNRLGERIFWRRDWSFTQSGSRWIAEPNKVSEAVWLDLVYIETPQNQFRGEIRLSFYQE